VSANSTGAKPPTIGINAANASMPAEDVAPTSNVSLVDNRHTGPDVRGVASMLPSPPVAKDRMLSRTRSAAVNPRASSSVSAGIETSGALPRPAV